MSSLNASYEIIGGFPQIDIGKLRHLVTFQIQGPASPPTFDEGGPVIVWNTVATAMAAIDIVGGTDVLRGGQTVTELMSALTIWYQPGFVSEMRAVIDNGSIYLIRSIANILEMNVVLVISCIGLQSNAR